MLVATRGKAHMCKTLTQYAQVLSTMYRILSMK